MCHPTTFRVPPTADAPVSGSDTGRFGVSLPGLDVFQDIVIREEGVGDRFEEVLMQFFYSLLLSEGAVDRGYV